MAIELAEDTILGDNKFKLRRLIIFGAVITNFTKAGRPKSIKAQWK